MTQYKRSSRGDDLIPANGNGGYYPGVNRNSVTDVGYGEKKTHFAPKPDANMMRKEDPYLIEKAKRLNYKLKDARDWKGIMRQVENHLESFNEVNIATALHRLAKIARDSNDKTKVLRDPRLSQLALKAQESISLFTPQQLSNSAWACATLSYYSNALLKCIENEALQKLDKFNSQDLTNTIWAYAKLNYKPKLLMSGIASEALLKLHDFNPQGLANTLWAFATLNHFGDQYPDLLAGIARESSKKINHFNPQNLANSVWAYARMSYHPGEALLERVTQEAIAKVDLFKPQELANLVWAYAKLNYRSEDLLASVGFAAERRLGQYNPQNLANTCWAYAVLNYHPGPLMDKLVDRAQKCLSDFSQQGLSNTAWALAKLNYNPGNRFLLRVGCEASKKITSFSPQGLVNLAWAFAKFNSYMKELMDLICRETESKLHAFNTQDIATLMWALATLKHYPRSLMQEICVLSERRLSHFTASALADMIYSLVLFRHEMTPFFLKLWNVSTAVMHSTKELLIVNEAVKLMQEQNGGIPMQLSTNLALRAQQASFTPDLEAMGALHLQSQTSRLASANGNSVLKTTSSVQALNTEGKEQSGEVAQDSWHYSLEAGLLMKTDSVDYSRSESFNLAGEQVVSSVLDTPVALDGFKGQRQHPMMAGGGYMASQPRPASAGCLQGINEEKQHHLQLPHSVTPGVVGSGGDSGSDVSYFSMWQSYIPDQSNLGLLAGDAKKNQTPHAGMEYLERLPSGRELVTPRSNLLSALSLDSSSGRSEFERSLFENTPK